MGDSLLVLTVIRSSAQEKKEKKPWMPRRKIGVFVSVARDLRVLDSFQPRNEGTPSGYRAIPAA